MFAPSLSPARAPLFAILLFVCFALPSAGQVLIVNRDVDHTVTMPLRDMPRASQNAPIIEREAEPARRIPLPLGLKPANEPDLALQRAEIVTPASLAPVQGTSFEGLGTGILGFTIAGAPPDTNGAVGLTQYVQWVNLSIAIFDKATGSILAGPVLGNSLFANLGGGCAANNNGDPVVNYDRLADRWVVSQFSISTQPFLHCVAVSTTSDATGTYNLYAFQYPNFNDYPKVGVWPDGYYATFNMFNGNAFVGASACSYDRAAMLSGLAATQICFQFGTNVGSILPADFDGRLAPRAGTPNFMLYGASALELLKFHVDFVVPANSTISPPTPILVAPFTPLCAGGTCVPQPGTATQLDSLADRLMYRAAYRNFGGHDSLVVNHAVSASGGGGIRWYEIQNPGTTPVLAQQGTYAPDNQFRWMGSIAMDRAG
ncbi:MAG: hypothetical protein LAP21_19655, partial [Acidobacteriia bacterium]|nr:hypothetical protein [Terriglobia bacterium]